MDLTRKRRSRLFSILVLLVLLSAALLVALLVYRQASGKPLGLRSFARDQIYYATSLVKSLQSSPRVKSTSQGNFTNVLFIHQSVGSGLIDQGSLRQILSERGYALWDHGYNWQGLRAPDGQSLGYTLHVPGDNTYPDGLSQIFAQPRYDLPINTFSSLMQHEVIILKSCYPANNLGDEAKAAAYRNDYLKMRDVMAQYPDKLFIVLTSPPLNPAETTPEAARRAREMAGWLMSSEFSGGYANIQTFNLFDQLAEADPARPDANMLRAAYRSGADSHPNESGSRAAGLALADFVDQTIVKYRGVYASEAR
jgi:hypothetical protein